MDIVYLKILITNIAIMSFFAKDFINFPIKIEKIDRTIMNYYLSIYEKSLVILTFLFMPTIMFIAYN